MNLLVNYPGWRSIEENRRPVCSDLTFNNINSEQLKIFNTPEFVGKDIPNLCGKKMMMKRMDELRL